MKKKINTLKTPTTVAASIFLRAPRKGKKEDIEKEGYFRLGHLATEFAELELLVDEVVYQFFFSDHVGLYLIDGNTLEKNLGLLENVSNYKNFWKNEIEAAIKDVRKIKDERNALIHGAWKIMYEVNTDEPLITVTRFRMREVKDINKEKDKKAKITKIHRETETRYTYKQIDELIAETKKIKTVFANVYAAIMIAKSQNNFK